MFQNYMFQRLSLESFPSFPWTAKNVCLFPENPHMLIRGVPFSLNVYQQARKPQTVASRVLSSPQPLTISSFLPP